MSFIASRKANVIYFNIPKAGCTSFKNWLYTLDYGKEYERPLDIHGNEKTLFIHYGDKPEEVLSRMQTSFVFTFVRHPLRRAYSLFNEKIYRTGPHTFQGVRSLLIEKYNADFSAPSTIDVQTANFLSFLRFIRDTQTEQIDFRKDSHWMPQGRCIRHALRIRPLDFIGRIETFQDDFMFVCKKSGLLPQAAPHYNESPKPPFTYEQILDDKIRELGVAIYAQDLIDFAYTI